MSLSDSDEAPEEVTFQESKASIKLQERKQKEAAAAAKRVSKQQRRDRDQRLKEQQIDRKQRKLLSELLKEEEESDDDDESSSIAPLRITTTPRQRPVSLEKEGITVKVRPSKVTKRLPPAGKSAVSKRDRFLFREQVPRK